MTTIVKPNTMPATAALVFNEPTEFIDRSLATASWWDKYEIQPGAYAFEWVSQNGYPWNPDPEVHTAGYLANVGPKWARVTLRVRLIEEYRVNRLFTASSEDHRVREDAPVTLKVSEVYPWQVPGSPRGDGKVVLDKFLGGRVERIEREDNYPGLTQHLSDAEYVQLHWHALHWYARTDYAEWEAKPADWRLWNSVNARYEGGMAAFVEAALDTHFPLPEHYAGEGWYAFLGGTRTVIDGPLPSWQEMSQHVRANSIHHGGYEIRYVHRGNARDFNFLP